MGRRAEESNLSGAVGENRTLISRMGLWCLADRRQLLGVGETPTNSKNLELLGSTPERTVATLTFVSNGKRTYLRAWCDERDSNSRLRSGAPVSFQLDDRRMSGLLQRNRPKYIGRRSDRKVGVDEVSTPELAGRASSDAAVEGASLPMSSICQPTRHHDFWWKAEVTIPTPLRVRTAFKTGSAPSQIAFLGTPGKNRTLRQTGLVPVPLTQSSDVCLTSSHSKSWWKPEVSIPTPFPVAHWLATKLEPCSIQLPLFIGEG